MEDENKMDVLTTKLEEFICDRLCEHRAGLSQDELDDVCIECEMSKHICNILNEYNRLNTFDNTQTAAVMKKYSGIVLCNECQYRVEDAVGIIWCRSTGGMSKNLSDNDGCSSGVRREADETNII